MSTDRVDPDSPPEGERAKSPPESPSLLSVWRARIRRKAERDQVPLRTILVTLALIVLIYLAGKLLYRLRDIILLGAVGGFIALILNPQVVVLQRWKVHRRGAAVAIVVAWSLLVFIGLAFAFGYPLVKSLTHLADNLPAYVQRTERGRGWIGALFRRYHVESWFQRNSPKLASLATSLARPALTLGKGAASVILELVTTFFFVVLLLLEAPKMKNFLLKLMSPQGAARSTRLGSEITRSVAGYVIGDVLTSVIAGIVVFITLTVLGVPFPFLWALWVALVDFLPQIGGALAGIPTVLFALTHSLTAGIVTAVVFLVYTQIENHVLNPVVMSKTVRINPLLVLISVLVGASLGSLVGGLFGGFVAALLAIPSAGALQVLVKEIWRATAPPPTDPEDPVNPPGELFPVSPDTREHGS